MQVNATDIFRVGSGMAAGAARKAAGIGAAGGGTRAEQDIVSISDLARQMQARDAQAGDAGFVAKSSAGAAPKGAASLADTLTGEVAKIFSHLSDEAKGTLERGVASGKVSVKEVEEGLKYLANNAVVRRARDERALGTDEIAAQKEASDLDRLTESFGAEMGAFSERYRNLDVKRMSGEISDEDYARENKIIGEEESNMMNSDMYKNIHERAGAAHEKAGKLAMSALTETLGGPPNEAKWQASMEKLDAIGFDVHRNRQSFKNYAATQDMPTLFRADAA